MATTAAAPRTPQTGERDPRVEEAKKAVENEIIKVETYMDSIGRPTPISPFIVKWKKVWSLLEALWHSPVKADPRAGKIISFTNRCISDMHGTTPNMIAGFQIIPPGEHGMAHKHTMAAIQYVVQGRGYSIINGTRFDWEQGDMVVFPAGAMHEHANLDPEKPAIFFHVLDVPAVAWTRNLKVEELPEGHQTVTGTAAT